SNLGAAEALAPIYEEANDAKKLARVYEVMLPHRQDSTEKVHLLRETALLYEEKLREPSLAFDRYLEAFLLDPTQEIIREDVARLAETVDGWGRMAEAYSDAMTRAESKDDEIALRADYGSILKRLGKTEEAIAQFRSVYDLKPDHLQAIGALGELYRATENFSDLMEIYDRRLELETDPQARRTLALSRASLLVKELGEVDRAIEAYQAVLDEHGDDVREAYAALDRLFEAGQRYQEMAGIIERRIDAGPETDEETASLRFRLGRVQEQHLGLIHEAVENYRTVVTVLPEHEGARDALHALLDRDDVGGSAAEILEPIYEMVGDWDNLVRVLNVLEQHTTDPDRKVQLATKVAEIYGAQLGDSSKSFDALCDAFAAAPQATATLRRLEMLAVEQERFEELVKLVSEQAAKVDDRVLARALWLKVAEFHATQLGNVDGSVNAYEKILEQDPGDIEVLEELENLYRRTERWADLAGVLRKKAEQSTNPEEQESFLTQMAHLYTDMLERPDDAILVYREILDLDPTSQRTLQALDKLYERQGQWSDLADNVERQIALAETPDQRVAFMLRSAQVRQQHMNAMEAAIEIYRDILEIDPVHGPALQALEALLNEEAHQLQVATILEPVYLDSNQYEKVIGVHEIQVSHAEVPERRVELLHKIAELYEMTLDNLSEAFRTYARALGEDPGHELTQQNLERLTAVTADYEALAKVYEDRVAGLEDAFIAATLHTKAAGVRQQLGQADAAIAHYRKVLEHDPDNLEAVTALEQLYQFGEQYGDLAGIFLRKARLLSDPDEQKSYFFRAAAAFEELLGQPEDAIAAYEAALEIDPEDGEALEKVAAIHAGKNDWAALLSTLNRTAEVTYDPEAKKAIFARIGDVYESHLSDNEKAIDSYQRILEIEPDDKMAMQRLDALYQAEENWPELMSILERHSELSDDPQESIALRFRIASLWRSKLSEPSRAVDIFREILDVAPEDATTIQALEGMIADGEEPIAAAAVLEPLYLQIGDWGRLVAVLDAQVKYENDPVRRVELLHRAAELWE
ncbi:MAG: tetratricopeptide repeat protein, partial [Myxococcales bacterium]|nr:tetratricopeptide repeat protein [Myxococcales bacterium]